MRALCSASGLPARLIHRLDEAVLGELIGPLLNLMHEMQLAYDLLQKDETTIQVLKENGRPATAKSFMWVRRGGAPGQTIILFDYAPSLAGAVPLRLLDEYKGYLQSDAYAGYNAPARRDGVIHVGCLDHARRKFVEAVKAQHAIAGHERGLVPEALLIIRKICGVEKLARDGKMSAEQRHKLRQEKARPIWDELRAWLDRNLNATPPQSLTGKAVDYLADEWPKLIRYLDDGALTPWSPSIGKGGRHASERVFAIVGMGRRRMVTGEQRAVRERDPLFSDTPLSQAAKRLHLNPGSRKSKSGHRRSPDG